MRHRLSANLGPADAERSSLPHFLWFADIYMCAFSSALYGQVQDIVNTITGSQQVWWRALLFEYLVASAQFGSCALLWTHVDSDMISPEFARAVACAVLLRLSGMLWTGCPWPVRGRCWGRTSVLAWKLRGFCCWVMGMCCVHVMIAIS